MPERGFLDVTQQQAEIVDSVLTNKITVVSAGAGTGKTHTTVAAVMEHLKRRVATVDQFVLITFTNKAADEMRKRLEQEIRRQLATAPSPEDRFFWSGQLERLAAAFIGTIHKFCQRLLKTFGYEHAVAREYDVTFARTPLVEAIKDAVEASLSDPAKCLLGDGFDWDEYQLRERIESILTYLRNRGRSAKWLLALTEGQPAAAGKDLRIAMAALVAEAERRYEERKAAENVLDATDLLVRTAQLLTAPTGAVVKKKIQERWHYLFVDEFQDTDPVQKQIVDSLLDYLRAVLVVGDRKQSIYLFRGADVSLLPQIAAENGVLVLPLSVSRRPTQAMLAVQGALFGSMGQTYPELVDPLGASSGNLLPMAGPDPFVYVAAGNDQRDRIPASIDRIRYYLTQQIQDPKSKSMRNVEPGDIALLFRSNDQLQQYANVLRQTDLPFRVESGGQFYRKEEIVSTYYLLRLLVDYPSDAALAAALTTPYLQASDAAAKEHEFIQYGSRTGSALTRWVEGTYPDLKETLKQLRSAIRQNTVPQLLALLYDRFGIRQRYLAQGDLQAVENLEKLREMARDAVHQEQALDLRRFVSDLETALLTGREEEEAQIDFGEDSDKRPPYIRLMTIHGSKGLEFPIVIIPEVQRRLRRTTPPDFLVDLLHGLEVDIPGREVHSPEYGRILAQQVQASIEEEMRIFYVGVTRASHVVTLIADKWARTNPPTSEWYSCKDEVLRARRALERVGAIFRT